MILSFYVNNNKKKEGRRKEKKIESSGSVLFAKDKFAWDLCKYSGRSR